MPYAGVHPYLEIIAAQLGNEAGLVGAGDLART
jgi:glucokinase